MKYQGSVYRPPNEANSLLMQVTIGCSWNKCTFCTMYTDEKFRVRPFNEVEEDVKNFQYKCLIENIFLCDGDALVLSNRKLMEILELIKKNFPYCLRVSSYATPMNIIKKSDEELQELVAMGLDRLYVGLESGSDSVLKYINKNVSRQEVIDACKKAKRNGFSLNLSMISGLGGRKYFEQHAVETASAISEIDPDFCRLATLVITDEAPLKKELESGDFKELLPRETLEEIRIMIESINTTKCQFTSSHPSNHIHIQGYLPEDRAKLLREIDSHIEKRFE